ncbi:hypothetical protein [Aminipila sp.]|uniref:hypothetical protein n=1 Tax=Aminipila sp. TaxID=2060095 RepID=UPI00289D93DF|nr:hypothetical protein [Aminipila sp.]
MKLKDKGTHEGPKRFSISILLYVVAAIVALLGIALLADDIYIFKSTVAQYVMQGYSADDVMKSLIPAQLLPGVFEAIALYGGMTFALIGIGIANRKISKNLITLDTVTNEESVEEKTLPENVDESENTEIVNEEAQNIEDEEKTKTEL